MDFYPAISAHKLTIGYTKGRKKLPILENLDFSIPTGQLTNLIGPNGIGKSTLIRTLSGLQPPLSGEISLYKKPIHKYSRAELSRILSLVLTGKTSAGNLSVQELVSLGRYPHTDWFGRPSPRDLEKIHWALSVTQLMELQNHKVHELSDGQVQRVMIARALAQDGKLMILDEPTAHLDLTNKIMIIKLLRDLATQTGKTILIATHELELSFHVADNLVLLNKNSQLDYGAPEDLILNGRISESMNNESVFFEENSGKFIPRKDLRRGIRLLGSGKVFYWTKNALERMGCFHEETQTSISVTINQDSSKLYWEIQYQNRKFTVYSIKELLDTLRTLTGT